MSLPFRNEVDVTLSLVGGVVVAVKIQPRARPPLARLFAGKPLTSLLDMLPRLFSLCAAAHQVAFVSAIEAARGQEVSLATRCRRIIRVLLERLTELLRGLYVGHLANDIASAAAIRGVIEATSVLVGTDAAARGPAHQEARAQAETAFTCLGFSDQDGTPTEGTPLAQAIAALEENALKVAAAEHTFLSVADDLPVVQRMFAGDTDFCDYPDLDRRVPETGVWARDMIRHQSSAKRPEPAERLRARIAEVARLYACLQAHDPEAMEDGVLVSYGSGHGRGAAVVECARGRLYYTVELDREGQITRVEFLAPTEWNFHPRGPLVRSLQGAMLAESRARQDGVRAMIGSFDPCVGFRLNLREVADA
ncbi:nickel-dependent hydrogenase large subunit [Bradyrhizobium sp. Tv2a-2]|uniref:nickel-dependent hydrogenase large subunit n=1 Tax=Bradyrhizobium sp. Tv2a-2 TaxID=113395 RepID=UPI00041A02E1|nr:nickel-dependent hydrogenase large subunit [Bradyrhizobium sp. Tv2a-2]